MTFEEWKEKHNDLIENVAITFFNYGKGVDTKTCYDELEYLLKRAFKAGRPKWHKPSEKLPADCSLVLAYDFEDSEPALFEFVTSDTWEWMPRRIACLSNDQIKCWCEIPKFDEE